LDARLWAAPVPEGYAPARLLRVGEVREPVRAAWYPCWMFFEPPDPAAGAVVLGGADLPRWATELGDPPPPHADAAKEMLARAPARAPNLRAAKAATAILYSGVGNTALTRRTAKPWNTAGNGRK
jgi:hypothetical protein